eukprot:2484742-Rhodomonas_salina.1
MAVQVHAQAHAPSRDSAARLAEALKGRGCHVQLPGAKKKIGGKVCPHLHLRTVSARKKRKQRSTGAHGVRAQRRGRTTRARLPRAALVLAEPKVLRGPYEMSGTDQGMLVPGGFSRIGSAGSVATPQ